MNKPENKNTDRNNRKILSDDAYEFARYLFHVLQHSGTMGLETWRPKNEAKAPTYMYSKS